MTAEAVCHVAGSGLHVVEAVWHTADRPRAAGLNK